MTRTEILALKAGTAVEVDLMHRTYHGPIIDTRHGWIPATVTGVGETLNGEINLWVTVDYPDGITGRDGSTSHAPHFTADSLCVRPRSE